MAIFIVEYLLLVPNILVLLFCPNINIFKQLSLNIKESKMVF